MIKNPFKVLAVLDLTFPEFNRVRECIKMNKALGETADELNKMTDKYQRVIGRLEMAKELGEKRENHIKELKTPNQNLQKEICDIEKARKCILQELNALRKDNEEFRKTIATKNKDIDHLLEENKKLKIDNEKLMFGYSATDMIFNGRATDKQYKTQVELFKKIDKKKVKKAYEEAYNDLIWCTSQPTIKPLHNGTIDSLIESNRAFTRKYVDEWLYKLLTKREEMWNDILSCEDCEYAKYVKVNKEDYQTFVKECADNNIN